MYWRSFRLLEYCVINSRDIWRHEGRLGILGDPEAEPRIGEQWQLSDLSPLMQAAAQVCPRCCKLLLLLCHVSHVRLLTTPWTVAHQAPLSMGFPRQKYWSGVPLPSPLVQDFNIKCLITLHLGLSPSLPLLKEISQVFRHHPYKKLIWVLRRKLDSPVCKA